MSENKDNIRLLAPVQKEEEVSHIRITYFDGTVETTEADSFGTSRDVENFLLFWKEDSTSSTSFFLNVNAVRKVEVIDGPLL
jgi:hypothetical protein